MSQEEYEALQARNRARVEAKKAEMGSGHLLHGTNQVKRKTPFRQTPKTLRAGLRGSWA